MTQNQKEYCSSENLFTRDVQQHQQQLSQPHRRARATTSASSAHRTTTPPQLYNSQHTRYRHAPSQRRAAVSTPSLSARSTRRHTARSTAHNVYTPTAHTQEMHAAARGPLHAGPGARARTLARRERTRRAPDGAASQSPQPARRAIPTSVRHARSAGDDRHQARVLRARAHGTPFKITSHMPVVQRRGDIIIRPSRSPPRANPRGPRRGGLMRPVPASPPRPRRRRCRCDDGSQ